MLHYMGIPHYKKILIFICLTIMIFTLAVPQQKAITTSRINMVVVPAQYLSPKGDYIALRTSLNRNEPKIKDLAKDILKLQAMVDRLRDQDNYNWVEMRVLYYDFNSSYQLAIAHAHDGRLLLMNHPGFSSSLKVENESMARWTVQRLRGAVTGLIARINECANIMRKANKLLRSSK
jgi:hypothetical protein